MGRWGACTPVGRGDRLRLRPSAMVGGAEGRGKSTSRKILPSSDGHQGLPSVTPRAILAPSAGAAPPSMRHVKGPSD